MHANYAGRCWRLVCSWMLHDVDWKIVADNSEDHNALRVLFTSKQLQA